MPEKTRCRSMNQDGSRCKHYTSDSSGLCNEHRDGMDFFNEGFLKCDNCVIHGCDYRGKGTRGFCYYEISDKTADLDQKIKVIEAMRRTIALEMRLSTRLERALNSLKIDDENYMGILSQLTHVNDQLNRHLNFYGRFLGWQSDQSTSSMREDRIKLLNRIFKEDNSVSTDAEGEKEEPEPEQVQLVQGDNSDDSSGK